MAVFVTIFGLWHFVYGDSFGFESHMVETTITAQQNWLVGESKFCGTVPTAERANRHLVWNPTTGNFAGDKTVSSAEPSTPHKAGYAFEYVKCDDGPGHLG
jgi:hypothetical protein